MKRTTKQSHLLSLFFDGILNEIASAFSKPRNDGILGILI